MEFPLKLKVMSLEKMPDGVCVECFYTVIDAKGEMVLPRNHFVCKAKEFDVVAAYTLDRMTARLQKAAPADVAVTPEAAALLTAIRGDQVPAPTTPAPTPLDQTISPPGPVRKVAVK